MKDELHNETNFEQEAAESAFNSTSKQSLIKALCYLCFLLFHHACLNIASHETP
jgi:hypothetical protein